MVVPDTAAGESEGGGPRLLLQRARRPRGRRRAVGPAPHQVLLTHRARGARSTLPPVTSRVGATIRRYARTGTRLAVAASMVATLVVVTGGTAGASANPAYSSFDIPGQPYPPGSPVVALT